MAIDHRRFASGAALLVYCAAAFSGCGGVQEAPVAARTDVFEITESDLAGWTPFLEGKRELRNRLRKAEDRRQELLRIVAMIRLVPLEFGELIPAAELDNALRDLEARQIRSTYLEAVLRPQIEVTEEEIRQIFSEHRKNYQKAEAVRVLEIFKWAPPDLPELRQRRAAELESLKARIESLEDFETAALEQSHATSAYKGGRIGSLFRDQTSGSLETALFSGEVGITDVVASDHGLYLFYVIDRLPARSNDLDDVADEIEKTLRRRRMQRLMVEDSGRLKDEYGLRVVQANESDDGQPRIWLGDELLTEKQLGMPGGLSAEAKIKRMEQRGLALIMERELAQRGVVPMAPNPMEMAWIRYRLAWRQAVATELRQTPPGQEAVQRDAGRSPNMERWNFDLIRVPAGEGAEAWDAAFRVCREIQPEAGLEAFRLRLARDYGLEGTIEEIRDVTSREAGPLGPEIHTTIKKILVPGEISAPLFLEDRGEVVVIHLHSKTIDPEATAAAAERRIRRRHRRNVEQRLETDLLSQHDFRLEPN